MSQYYPIPKCPVCKANLNHSYQQFWTCGICNDDVLRFFNKDLLFMSYKRQKTKAIILCAGRGSRMQRYTDDMPKCMIPINGKPLVMHQIETLRELGISDITIVTGYQHEKITVEGVKYIHDKNHENHDVLGSLYCAREILNGNVILSYGDLIYSKADLATLLKSSLDFGILADKSWQEKNHKDVDTVTSVDGVPREFSHSVNGDEFIGVCKFSGDGCRYLLSAYEKNPSLSGKKLIDLFDYLLKQKHGFGIDYVRDDWFEIDTPSDLEIKI